MRINSSIIEFGNNKDSISHEMVHISGKKSKTFSTYDKWTTEWLYYIDWTICGIEFRNSK